MAVKIQFPKVPPFKDTQAVTRYLTALVDQMQIWENFITKHAHLGGLNEFPLVIGGAPSDHSVTGIKLSPALPGVTSVLTIDSGGNLIWVLPSSIGISDHLLLSNLTTGDSGHTQFALLAGRSGGQVLMGGITSGESLDLTSNNYNWVNGSVYPYGTQFGSMSITSSFMLYAVDLQYTYINPYGNQYKFGSGITFNSPDESSNTTVFQQNDGYLHFFPSATTGLGIVTTGRIVAPNFAGGFSASGNVNIYSTTNATRGTINLWDGTIIHSGNRLTFYRPDDFPYYTGAISQTSSDTTLFETWQGWEFRPYSWRAQATSILLNQNYVGNIYFTWTSGGQGNPPIDYSNTTWYGTRLMLLGGIYRYSSTSTNFAIGVNTNDDTGAMWFSTCDTNTWFRFYGGRDYHLSIRGNGDLITDGNITINKLGSVFSVHGIYSYDHYWQLFINSDGYAQMDADCLVFITGHSWLYSTMVQFAGTAELFDGNHLNFAPNGGGTKTIMYQGNDNFLHVYNDTTGLGISFDSGSFNMLRWTNTGVSAPTQGTRSAGSKLVLFPEIDYDTHYADWAIGIEPATMWFSVGGYSGTQYFKWYYGSVLMSYLDNVNGYTAKGGINLSPASGTIYFKTFAVDSDTQPVFAIRSSDGMFEWGAGGTSAYDLYMYRASSTTMQLQATSGDSNLILGGLIGVKQLRMFSTTYSKYCYLQANPAQTTDLTWQMPIAFLGGNGVMKASNAGVISLVAGASGSFTTVDLKTVTVVDGIITSIV